MRNLRLTEKKLKHIKKLFDSGMRQWQIAELYNVSQPTICEILQGKRKTREQEKNKVSGSHARVGMNFNHKITVKEAKKIKKLYFTTDVSQTELSVMYHISQSQISRIVHGLEQEE